MSTTFASVIFALTAFLSIGCVVYRDQPAGGPLIEGPSAEVIDVEPPPQERVYVYDPGYPPGVYFYDNYYWFGRYRYERNVFVDRVVNINVRENRFVNPAENRRVSQRIEQTQRTTFARTGGRNEGPRPTEIRTRPPVQNTQTPKKPKKPGES